MQTTYHVCLDPGHGPSCANKSPDGSYEEQEFAMDLATRLSTILRAHGLTVSLTRGAAGYPSLSERCRIANAVEGLALFVSLHSNAAGGGGWSEARGHLIFTAAPEENAPRNRAARAILRQWEALGLATASALRHENFSVLSGTRAPALLLEHGFHTNRAELCQLQNGAFRQALAEADARGILDFLGILPQDTSDANRRCVKSRFALSEETMDYLAAYRFGEDLFAKLANGR